MNNQPHDALFKWAFSSPQNAGEELRCVLPPAVVEKLDWDTLRPAPSEFTDEVLRSSAADLLFTISTTSGRPALLYLLFEHQSTAHALMPLRLFLYTARIWESWLRHNVGARRVPPVLSVVLHHASESQRGWAAPTRLAEIYDAEPSFVRAAGPHLPALTILLDDLSAESDDALGNRAVSSLVRLLLLLLKHGRSSPDIDARLSQWVTLAKEVAAAPTGASALEVMMHYLSQVSDHATAEGVGKMLRSVLGRRGEEIAMGFGHQLREEGREEMRKAMREAMREQAREAQLKQQELLLVQLEQRFGEVSEQDAARVRNASTGDVERWFRNVLVADSLAALFAV